MQAKTPIWGCGGTRVGRGRSSSSGILFGRETGWERVGWELSGNLLSAVLAPLGHVPLGLMDRALFVSASESRCHSEEACVMI